MEYKLSTVLSNVGGNDDSFVYSVENKNRGYSFGFTDDLGFFIEQYMTIPEQERVFYEIFREDKCVKLFFDIDIDPNGDRGSDSLFSACDVYREFQVFLTDFHRVYLGKIIQTDLMVLDSSETGYGKISLHVQCLRNHFRDINHMKDYYVGMKEFLDHRSDYYKYAKFIDFGICTKNRSMRIIGSHKRKSPNRVLSPAPYCCNTKRYPQVCKEWFATHIGTNSIVLPPVKTRGKVEKKVAPAVYPVRDDDDMYNQCKLLISVLKTDTARKYKSWYSIGCALYTTLKGSQRGLELWLEFSAKSLDSFNKEECIRIWEKGEMKGYTFGTLVHYFQQDREVLSNNTFRRRRLLS